MSHTPGPWRPGNSRDSVVSSHGTRNPDADAYYGGNLIAESINPRDRDLIAAAPELLEALVGISALYEADEGCRSLPQYIAARRAIAKATGGGL